MVAPRARETARISVIRCGDGYEAESGGKKGEGS